MPKYDAFISYSHSADARLAPAVRDGLQKLAKPWNKRRALNVFLDQASLEVSAGLKASLQAKLLDTDWLILLLSEDSARSVWVGAEIENWVTIKPKDRIVLALTEGELAWAGDDWDWSRSTAAPRSLSGIYAEEPLWLDLRRYREDPNLDIRSNPAFKDHLASLAAPLHGTTKEELVGEDLVQFRRARRLRRAAIAGLAVLTLAALTGAFVAVRNAQRANREAAIATSRQLAANAGNATDGQLDRALLLAVDSWNLRQTEEAEVALFAALARRPGVVRFVGLHEDPVSALATSPVDGLVASGDESGEVVLWTPDDSGGWARAELPRVAQDAMTTPQTVTALAFSADGRRLAWATSDDFESGDGTLVMWDVAAGEAVWSKFTTLEAPDDEFRAPLGIDFGGPADEYLAYWWSSELGQSVVVLDAGSGATSPLTPEGQQPSGDETLHGVAMSRSGRLAVVWQQGIQEWVDGEPLPLITDPRWEFSSPLVYADSGELAAVVRRFDPPLPTGDALAFFGGPPLPAEGVGPLPDEGDAPPEEGDEGTARDGDEGSAEEDVEASPADGEEAAPEEGDALPEDGDAPPEGGDGAPPEDGDAPPGEGDGALPEDGDAPPEGGEGALPEDGDAPPEEGDGAPPEDGDAPPEEGDAGPPEERDGGLDGSALLDLEYEEFSGAAVVSAAREARFFETGEAFRFVEAVALSPDASLLAMAERDGTLRVQRLDGGPEWPAAAWQSGVASLSFDSAGQRLVIGGTDGAVVVWDPAGAPPLADRLAIPGTVCALGFGGIAVIGSGTDLSLWDAERGGGRQLEGFQGDECEPFGPPDYEAPVPLAVGPSGSVVAALDRTPEGIALAEGDSTGALPDFTTVRDEYRDAVVAQLAVADSSPIVAAAGTDMNRFGADWLAWAGADGIVHDMASRASITAVALDPTGGLLAWADVVRDGRLTISVLDTSDGGVVLREPLIGEELISSLVLDLELGWLAAGFDDGTVRLFSLQAGDGSVPLLTGFGPPLRGHRHPVTSMAFRTSPLDGRLQLLTAGGVEAFAWDLDVMAWQERACFIANRAVSAREVNDFSATGSCSEIATMRRPATPATSPTDDRASGPPTTTTTTSATTSTTLASTTTTAPATTPTTPPDAEPEPIIELVHFDSGSVALDATARVILNRIAATVADDESLAVTVGGHTDDRGTDAANQALSERRAEVVVAYLAGRGVDESRITTAGLGASEPDADNDTAEGRAANRRVELRLVVGNDREG